MGKLTIEQLSKLKTRHQILSQDEFRKVFRDSALGALKIEDIHDHVQYKIAGEYFSIQGFYWVKTKQNGKFLKAVLENDNGYVKREVYLSADQCVPACYQPDWKTFINAGLENAVDLSQTIIPLQTLVTPAITAPVEAY